MILEKLNSLKPLKTLPIRRRGLASGLSKSISTTVTLIVFLILVVLKIDYSNWYVLAALVLGHTLLGALIFFTWLELALKSEKSK